MGKRLGCLDTVYSIDRNCGREKWIGIGTDILIGIVGKKVDFESQVN